MFDEITREKKMFMKKNDLWKHILRYYVWKYFTLLSGGLMFENFFASKRYNGRW